MFVCISIEYIGNETYSCNLQMESEEFILSMILLVCHGTLDTPLRSI